MAIAAASAGSTAHTTSASNSTQFTLSAGTDTSSQKLYTFLKGYAYTITISGTLTRDHTGATPPFTTQYDAFYSTSYSDGSQPGSWPGSGSQNGVGVGVPGNAAGSTEPGNPQVQFRPDHTYTWLVPNNWFSQDTTLYFWAQPLGYADPWTTTYSGSFSVTIVANPPPPQVCSPPWAAAPDAHAAAINEVHVICAQPDCQFHKGGAPADAWLPAEVDTILKAGDEVSCDPDGALTLAFASNETAVVQHTTQLKIGSFFTSGGIIKTLILLKMGEVAAQVNKSEATASDFRIVSPTGTISVRGTIFKVFYDPGSGALLVSTKRGTVTVRPSNRRLHTVLVKAGREVEVTKKFESPIAAIGKAGARGGVDVLKARDLVLALIAHHNQACNTSTPRSGAFAVLPARRGWTVKVKLTGTLHGTSIWSVSGRKVRPANSLAKKLARC